MLQHQNSQDTFDTLEAFRHVADMEYQNAIRKDPSLRNRRNEVNLYDYNSSRDEFDTDDGDGSVSIASSSKSGGDKFQPNASKLSAKVTVGNRMAAAVKKNSIVRAISSISLTSNSSSVASLTEEPPVPLQTSTKMEKRHHKVVVPARHAFISAGISNKSNGNHLTNLAGAFNLPVNPDKKSTLPSSSNTKKALQVGGMRPFDEQEKPVKGVGGVNFLNVVKHVSKFKRANSQNSLQSSSKNSAKSRNLARTISTGDMEMLTDSTNMLHVEEGVERQSDSAQLSHAVCGPDGGVTEQEGVSHSESHFQTFGRAHAAAVEYISPDTVKKRTNDNGNQTMKMSMGNAPSDGLWTGQDPTSGERNRGAKGVKMQFARSDGLVLRKDYDDSDNNASFYSTMDPGSCDNKKADFAAWNRRLIMSKRIKKGNGKEHADENLTPKQVMERRGLAKLQQRRQKQSPKKPNHNNEEANMFSPIKRGTTPRLKKKRDKDKFNATSSLSDSFVNPQMCALQSFVEAGLAAIEHENIALDHEGLANGLQAVSLSNTLKRFAAAEGNESKISETKGNMEKNSSKKQAEDTMRQQRDLHLDIQRKKRLMFEKKGYISKNKLKISNAQVLSGYSEYVFLPNKTATSLGQRMKAGVAKITDIDAYIMRMVSGIDKHVENKLMGKENSSMKTLYDKVLNSEFGYRRDIMEIAAMELGVNLRPSPDTVLTSKQILDAIYLLRFNTLSQLSDDFERAHLGYVRKSLLTLRNDDHLPQFIYVPSVAKSSLGQRLKVGYATVTEEDRCVMSLVERIDQHIEKFETGVHDLTPAELFEELSDTSCGFPQEYLGSLCVEFGIDHFQMSNTQNIIEAVYNCRNEKRCEYAELKRLELLGYTKDVLSEGEGMIMPLRYSAMRVEANEACLKYVREVIEALDRFIDMQQLHCHGSPSSLTSLLPGIVNKENGYTRDKLEEAAVELGVDRDSCRHNSPEDLLNKLLLQRKAARYVVDEETRYSKIGYVRRSATALTNGNSLPEYIYMPKHCDNCLKEKLQNGQTSASEHDLYIIQLVGELDKHVRNKKRYMDMTSLHSLFHELQSQTSFSIDRLCLVAQEFGINGRAFHPSAVLFNIYEKRLSTICAVEVGEMVRRKGYLPISQLDNSESSKYTCDGIVLREKIAFFPRLLGLQGALNNGAQYSLSDDICFATSVLHELDSYISDKLSGRVVCPLSDVIMRLTHCTEGYTEDRLTALHTAFEKAVSFSCKTSKSSPEDMLHDIFCQRLSLLAGIKMDCEWQKRGYCRTNKLAITNSDGLPDFVFVPMRPSNSLNARLEKGSTTVSHDERYVMLVMETLDSFIGSRFAFDESRSLPTKIVDELLDAKSGYTVQGLKLAAHECFLELDATNFEPENVIREIYFKRHQILSYIHEDLEFMKIGKMRTHTLNILYVQGLPSMIYIPQHIDNSLLKRLHKGSTSISGDEVYIIRLIHTIDSHIQHALNGHDAVPVNEMISQLICKSSEHSDIRLNLLCKEFGVDSDWKGPQDVLNAIYAHRFGQFEAAMRDRDRNVLGYYRSNTLALNNAEGLPEYIFLAKCDPLALGSRLNRGSTDVNSDDKFVMEFIGHLDDLVKSTEESLDEVSSQRKCDIIDEKVENFCVEQFNEDSGYSLHRLRLAAAECAVTSSTKCNKELVIAMYESRANAYRQFHARKQFRKGCSLPLTINVQNNYVDYRTGEKQISPEGKGNNQEIHTLSPSPSPLLPALSPLTATRSRRFSEDEIDNSPFITSPDVRSSPIQAFATPSKKDQHSTTHRKKSRPHLSDNGDLDPKGLLLPEASPARMDTYDILQFTGHNELGKGHGGRSASGGTQLHLRKIHASQSKHQGLVLYSDELNPLRADLRSNNLGVYKYDQVSKSTTLVRPDMIRKSGITVKAGKLSQAHNPTAENALVLEKDRPHIPWIPKGGLDVMVSCKEDMLFGWEERRDIGLLAENNAQRSILKRQDVVRESFENYARHLQRQDTNCRNNHMTSPPKTPPKPKS